MGAKETTSKTYIGDILIILAGLFWGSMGLFVRHLASFGFTSIQIASLRLSCAAIIYVIILFFKDRKGFKIALRDIPLFLGLGLLSILFFTYCYFTAIQIMAMSTAAILLYTSPIWVMLMSLIFFKEKLTSQKIIALILAFLGCVLVSGIGGGKVTVWGLLVGLGSGIGYGLYSILGTVALRKYSTYTVTTYTFIVAGLGSFFVADTPDMISKLQQTGAVPSTLLFVLVTAIFTAVIPYLLYTLGLSKTTASRAAILATVEPVTATIFGFFVMHEKVSMVALVGIVLVLLAIAVLNIRSSKKNEKK
ncbi:MAG: DMT family transporter [Clostridia bacterium]|nr:DMT family transporter [Clostridia bacterium]